MEVTKLTNNRVYFEEEYYRINIDIITEFSLKKGMILNEQTSKELFVQLILFRSYSILMKRDYTTKELRMKLQMEFPRNSPFGEVLEILKEKSYLDDYAYAKNYIENKGLSKKRVFYDLTLRGIKKEVITEIYNLVQCDEKADIKKLMPKLDKKEERKKVEYLLRKGYNLKDILEVIREKG